MHRWGSKDSTKKMQMLKAYANAIDICNQSFKLNK